CAQVDWTGFGLQPHFDQPRLALQQPSALRASWLGAPRLTPSARVAAFDAAVQDSLVAGRAERALGLRMRALYGLAEMPPNGEEEQPTHRNLLGLKSKYADLALDGQVRLELRTDRLREERCTPALSL